MTMVEAEEEQL